MKKLCLISALIFLITPALAYNTTIHFFYGSGCPHCAEERVYINSLNIDGLTIKDYEVWYDEVNATLYSHFAEAYNTYDGGQVPRIFIGDKVFIGFNNEDNELLYSENYKAYLGYRNQIHSAISNCVNNGCPDPWSIVYGNESVGETNATTTNGEAGVSEIKTINLPFFGEINVMETSIIFLTIIIGLLDGFNPCAMWMLTFLLTFVIATHSRKKVFLIGGIFILVSGIVYFLFITAWFNVFLSAAAIAWFRFIAGGFAMFAGIINIKDFFAFQKGFSLTIPAKWQPKIRERMKYLADVAKGAGLIGGVIFLAFTINLVELMCTIGFPVIYLNILTQHGFPTIVNYAFLLLYVIMYMLDDLGVFIAAVVTMSLFKMEQKHVRRLKLISGVIMVALALILMIKPELLMFG